VGERIARARKGRSNVTFQVSADDPDSAGLDGISQTAEVWAREGKSQMPHPRISNEEIDRRGQELYEKKIRDQVETPENIGKQIVIDIESGEYQIDDDGLKASRSLLSKHPDAALYGLRIGYDAVYTIGGVLKQTTRR